MDQFDCFTETPISHRNVSRRNSLV